MENCIFCKIISNQLPATIVAETDLLLVFKDINPRAKTHFLIIPKKHCVNMKDVDSINDQILPVAFFEMVKNLSLGLDGAQEFNLLCNNGAGAGQIVFHLHWHFVSENNFAELNS